MTKNILQSIDIISDHWVITASNKKFHFNFESLPNDWFKKTLKEYVRSSVENNSSLFTTLNYYKSSVSFFKFLAIEGKVIQSFSEIDHEMIRKFEEYLSNKYKTLAYMSGLKHVIDYGRKSGWEGYPTVDPFNKKQNYWVFNLENQEVSKNNDHWIKHEGTKSFYFHFDLLTNAAFNNNIKELVLLLLNKETISSEYVYVLFLHVRFFIETLKNNGITLENFADINQHTIELFFDFTAESDQSKAHSVIKSIKKFIEFGITNQITGFPSINPLGRVRMYNHDLISEVWNEKRDKWTVHDGNGQRVFYFDYLPNDTLKGLVKNYIVESVREQTNSVITMHSHNIRLQYFFNFINNSGRCVNQIKEINADLINSYRSFLADTKSKTRTGDYIGTIKHFLHHGARKKWEHFSHFDFFDDIDEEGFIIYGENNNGKVAYRIKLGFFPNEWFKENFRRYVSDYLSMKKAKPNFLAKCNMEIRSFFAFLQESKIQLDTFTSLNRDTLEMFMMYLLSQKPSSTARVRAFGALKSFVKHGQRMDWGNFPTQELFDDVDYKILRTEDIKRTQVIPDDVMEQIRNAVSQPNKDDLKDILTCCLIEILMYTGIRVSEALNLREDCIKSLLGKKVLHIVSNKNLTERYIAIPKQVEKAVETIKVETKNLREAMRTDRLFVFYSYRTKENDFVETKHTYSWITKFVNRYGIKDNNGSLYALHAHQFRHTLATDMLNTGLSLLEIKEYLGHKDIKSTLRYAKVLKWRLNKVVKDIGFVGLITENLETGISSAKASIPDSLLKTASLPDGICKKPINNEGKMCKKLNMCLFCSKFITTPEYLPVHQSHLKRIRNDKTQYMQENFIGTYEHLEKIEKILENIIKKLEEMPRA